MDTIVVSDSRRRDYPHHMAESDDVHGGSGHPVPLPSAIRPPKKIGPREETSAGGLVLDLATQPPCAALIGRLDRRGRILWSLPKGHIEAGETAAQTAVREVQEETGIWGKVVGVLGDIDYWFVADGQRIHKTVHHFLLERTGGSLCDEDPEVVEVSWVALPDVLGRLAYADERRLVEPVAAKFAERES